MSDSRLTRRRLLASGAAGAVALALPGPALGRRSRALPVGGGLRPELVGVSQRGFEAWWPTEAPADTTVRYARADGQGGVRERVLAHGQVVHAARVSGLEPGTGYRYELRSGGHAIATSIQNPGTFTTLPRLEGPRLARIAVLNDMHVGEQCSGTITDLGFGSVPPCFTGDDYAWRMCDAALREIKALRPDLVIANGDLTDRGRPLEVDRALGLLRRSKLPRLITRGTTTVASTRPREPVARMGIACARRRFRRTRSATTRSPRSHGSAGSRSSASTRAIPRPATGASTWADNSSGSTASLRRCAAGARSRSSPFTTTSPPRRTPAIHRPSSSAFAWTAAAPRRSRSSAATRYR